MQIRKSYKFKLKTNPAIEETLWSYGGQARYIWNYFLRANKDSIKNIWRMKKITQTSTTKKPDKRIAHDTERR